MLFYAILSRFAYRHEIYSAENQHNSHTFGGSEHIKSEYHPNDGSHNRLHIIIHPHKSGTKVLLTYHYAYIGEICGATYNKRYSAPLKKRYISPLHECPFLYRERYDSYRGKGKHPFHQCHHRILFDEIAVESEI